MYRKPLLVIAASLAALPLLIALAAHASTGVTSSLPTTAALDEDAVVLELVTAAEPSIRMVLALDQMGTLQLPGEDGALGILVEEIDERGAASVALYRLDNPYVTKVPRGGSLGEQQLTVGDPAQSLGVGARHGNGFAGVQARLIEVILTRR